MIKSIVISENQKQNLIKFAQENSPNESCAILLGVNQEDTSKVEDIFLAKNIEESPVNFTISNEDLLFAYKRAEEKNKEVIGIFHSHPNSEAFPSSTDKKFMLINPVIWVIYSGSTSDLKAFVLDSEIQQVPITISQV